jgi:hypothetical protein
MGYPNKTNPIGTQKGDKEIIIVFNKEEILIEALIMINGNMTDLEIIIM